MKIKEFETTSLKIHRLNFNILTDLILPTSTQVAGISKIDKD